MLDEKTLSDIDKIAQLLKEAKNAIVFTGSGMGVSAGLPEMEIPTETNPIFSHSIKPLSLLREQAAPTTGYMAISELYRKKLIRNVLTTTVDCLHQRSGIPQENVIELFGNCFEEYCPLCNIHYRRDFDVTSVKSQSLFLPKYPQSMSLASISDPKTAPVPPPIDAHNTGRVCTNRIKETGSDDGKMCGKPLRDMLVHNGEQCRQMQKAMKIAEECDVFFCVGSSLAQSPIIELPVLAKQNKAKIIIISSHKTTLEALCDISIQSSRCDAVLHALCDKLQCRIPQYVLSKAVAIGHEVEELPEQDKRLFKKGNGYRWTVYVRPPPPTSASASSSSQPSSSYSSSPLISPPSTICPPTACPPPLSSFIERVVFTLPPSSFSLSTITLDSEPFEVTRVGHSNVDVKIAIHVVANGKKNIIFAQQHIDLAKGGGGLKADLDMTGLID
ncbi:putative silent information regulator family protein [Monocercomonoides exilis]|uniref:putative silent information regulator family protein n=1 Tax=Monocercomonoides exilis TaxID=2049356 RepID=UPI00355A24B8|nr:putative silent information regulator family protein [Monocercomonoides exilis]|eukprot:MONOS_1938.1-p1 / transcript=MONOS_1938.1 / gene=MONOS_1938 / organism=Monocercomonoides_exilis_PA203 / gene_product=silent information regulator family protein / transcript_product=silent information regulator family protein / location=Mono_scaffold00037:75307-77196(-) / protein_length=443 / sequence_SO=supercontig / SO=protein_coding / is_pseudo=false